MAAPMHDFRKLDALVIMQQCKRSCLCQVLLNEFIGSER